MCVGRFVETISTVKVCTHSINTSCKIEIMAQEVSPTTAEAEKVTSFDGILMSIPSSVRVIENIEERVTLMYDNKLTNSSF